MKKFLLDNTKNYYKANMHCHSTYSDGKYSVEELKNMYKEKGYSVIAFTDHEHLINNSRLNDDSFLAITSCEIAVKEFETKSAIKARDMKVAHLNLYSLDPDNIDTPCFCSVYDPYLKREEVAQLVKKPKRDYKRKYSKKGISKIIKTASNKGFLVSYNHPRWSLETAKDYLGYKGLWATEIFNTSCWRQGYFEYNIQAYDDMLRNGNCKFCVEGDDNHKDSDMFGGHIMINAEKLEYSAIMSALKDGNFYSSVGPEINSLYIEDNVAHLSVPKGNKYVTMSTGIRYAERKILENEDINDIQFKISPEYKYVRFDVVDENGLRANTNAYTVTE